jgi:hypothetical protein
MSRRKWLILTALEMEAQAISSELGGPATFSDTPVPLAVTDVSLHLIGIKAVRIKPELFCQFDSILLAGLGGALDPTLSVGDIVIDTTDPNIPSPGTSGEGQGEGLFFHRGKILTSDHMISTIAEKTLRFRETGCIAVDMEATIVRPHLQSAGIPLLHIRAISDTAAEALPERISGWINDVGVPRMAQVTADLAFHPHLIPAMIRIGNNSRIAARHLAQAVRQILRNQD